MSSTAARWLAFGLALAAFGLGGCGAGAPEKPNVVVISLDTLRADALGAYGESRATSPTFDRFASGAVVFDHAFSQAPMTAPSHMTLFTSLYPSVHRVNNLGAEGNRAQGKSGDVPAQWRVDPNTTTLAELFRSAGWRTAAFHGGGNVNKSVGFDDGFEWFDGKPQNGMNGNADRPFDFTRAAAWIDEHADEPFFLFLHTYVPHAPYVPPAPWDRAFDPDYAGPIPYRDAFLAAVQRGEPGPPPPGDGASAARKRMLRHTPWQFWGYVDPDSAREVQHVRALYAGDVRTTDDALATMLAKLADAGLDERTIVVVLSDHGEGFLEHGVFEHPGKLYRELVHVPLALRVPGLAPARVAAPVGLIDVAPTLCELVGLPTPASMQGRSFAGELRGSPAPATRAVWSEFVPRWRDSEAGFVPLDLLRARRDARWTYLATLKDGVLVEELYDRSVDPGETRDLAALPEHEARRLAFRAELEAEERACAAARAKLTTQSAGELEQSTLDDLKQLGYAR
ncbi:MAG: sulfatase [Planctomycetes bacterium]|nr:sulfatase [Planctomycetota bacterium]